MRDLLIGHRRSGQPRAWRAALIGIGLMAAAGVVAWVIFERSGPHEPPPGEAGGMVQGTEADEGGGGGGEGSATSGPGPAAAESRTARAGALTYRGSRLEWRGGVAVLHVAGSAHALGAAHGR